MAVKWQKQKDISYSNVPVMLLITRILMTGKQNDDL